VALDIRSYFLTRDIAGHAVHLVRPAIERCMHTVLEGQKNILFKRDHLAIVILNPTIEYNRAMENSVGEPSLPVLHQVEFGDSNNWEHPYLKIAQSKARVTWRTGFQRRDVLNAPHLLREGDTPFYGSVIREGLVVAVSGVQPYFDEMIAGWVADTCIALTRHMANAELTGDKGNFLGEKLR